MTEPEAGSDVGPLTTEAKRVDGGFVINGQKGFCSNARISGHILVVCRTTKGGDKQRGPVDDLRPHQRRRSADGSDRHGVRESEHLCFTDEAPEDPVLGEVDYRATDRAAPLAPVAAGCS